MPFSDSFLQELTEHNDIVDVVSEYVQLTKRSGRNQFGLCPFHSEKTPSFSVNADKQIFHCFGCGKGGGVISFIMEMENLDFRDAVAFLARRAGMRVPEEDRDPGAGRRERLLTLQRDAARFFHDCLQSAPGAQRAQDYVRSRGISPKMVRVFGLGFAPDSWDSLTGAMGAQGYTEEELLGAGLAKTGKSRGIYDAFRDRLMFPVIDVRGSVIGFSGRALSDGGPKYLNSPETPIFSKSRNLFALNLAKKSKNGYIILSEGNIDVVSLHQAGFDSAVASLGTSLTAEQARLISRYKQEVIIAYDNDAAGQKAADRAIGILEKLDLRVRVLQMAGAKDPDEFLQKKGAEAFRALLEASENQVEFRLASLKSGLNLDTDDGRVGYLRRATELLAALPNRAEREVYAARVAETVNISPDAVVQEAERLRKRLDRGERGKREREATSPLRTAQPKERGLRYEDAAVSKAEEGVLRLLCADPALFQNTDLAPEEFSNTLLQKLYAELLHRAQSGESLHVDALSQVFSPAEISHLTRLLQEPVSLQNAAGALADYIKKIRSRVKEGADEAALLDYWQNRRSHDDLKG